MALQHPAKQVKVGNLHQKHAAKSRLMKNLLHRANAKTIKVPNLNFWRKKTLVKIEILCYCRTTKPLKAIFLCPRSLFQLFNHGLVIRLYYSICLITMNQIDFAIPTVSSGWIGQIFNFLVYYYDGTIGLSISYYSAVMK